MAFKLDKPVFGPPPGRRKTSATRAAGLAGGAETPKGKVPASKTRRGTDTGPFALKGGSTSADRKAAAPAARPVSAAPAGTGPRAKTMATKAAKGSTGALTTSERPKPRPAAEAKATGLGRLGRILSGNKANIQSKALERMKKSGRKG